MTMTPLSPKDISPPRTVRSPLARQQPEWPADRLRQVTDRLALAPGPVSPEDTARLAEELERAAAGHGFVLVGGDCAELFADATPARILHKAGHLHELADTIERAGGVPTTRIGRFGGQFAKPRSGDWETLPDGRRVPSYRGDAVNGVAAESRQADPDRLLTAHRLTRGAVQALTRWDRRRAASASGAASTYLGHEALLLDYERALLRDRGRHATTGHYLWIGDRTRHLDDAHVAFAAAVDNPVGVKLGPSSDPGQVRPLVQRLLASGRRPGSLSLVVRMGADRCAELLPPIVTALGPLAHEVLWISDPMHGNGRTNIHGQKTRLMTDITAEIRSFFAVLAAHTVWPGGVHLELTPDHVTECVSGGGDLADWLPHFRSACDPRLNPTQSAEVMALVADLLTSR